MRGYGEQAMRHFMAPQNVGTLDDATARGAEGTPGRGNYMILWMKIADDVIEAISYQTYGCPGVVCCGSAITAMALGASLEQAHQLTPDAVLEYLGGLPLGKRHCAGLAVAALQSALDSHPWTPTE